MSTMSRPTLIPLAEARDRSRRLSRAVDARRRLDGRDPGRGEDEDRRGGRAWLNGSELGGARAALAHLAEGYD